MRTHRHKLQFKVFSDYQVVVIFTDNIGKELAKLTDQPPTEGAQALTVINTGGNAHVFFPHNPDAETIAHEAVHVIHALMKWAGAEPEDEVIAYHLGYLVRHITKWAKR